MKFTDLELRKFTVEELDRRPQNITNGKRTAYDRWYRSTEWGAAVKKRAAIRFRNSSKGKASAKRYNDSPERKEANGRYAQTPKGKDTRHNSRTRYAQSLKGKACAKLNYQQRTS